MKKNFALFAALLLVFAGGCGDGDKQSMPKNELAYENKTNSELIPSGDVEESSATQDDDAGVELPSEDELGEYQEILLDGDILDDGSRAGWVLAISLKDITVNTYNEITTYTLVGNAKNCVEHIKPGDAVLISCAEEDDGSMSAYDVGKIRVDSDPLTKDEIAEMYSEAEQTQNGAEASPED